MRTTSTWVCWLLAAVAASGDCASTALAADSEVTIYRCTDAKGKLTLRDTPCAKGQQQQTRSMLRPKDAALRARPAPRPQAAYESPPQRILIRNAPRPLYECVRPDGSRYTSDTGDGAPRYVPLWTLDYPVAPMIFAPGAGIGISPMGPSRDRSGPRQPIVFPGLAYAGASTWVRDECYALPPEEVCARLGDRRDEIRRRFFNAQPSERATLDTEERGINARLSNDCGGY